MSPASTASAPRPRHAYRGFYVTAAVLLGLSWAVVGITGYFRLGSDTQALRDTFLRAAPGHWQKKFALHIGFCTTALVRTVAREFKIQPEAQAALQAVHGAEFGIYNLDGAASPLCVGALLTRADQVMGRRGWQRVVGVMREGQLVAVYAPRRGISARRLNCAVVVLQDQQLVVAGVRGNIEPLAEIAARRLELSSKRLALR
jgi:hypothetical protein